ncbi:MAG: hypothetical protein IKA55_04730 [Akkermansia sp.]|nr:hypothetical protein [Akkermansia sp.]
MSREFQVYNGATPQSAQVSGKQVPYFGGIPQNGAAVDQALGQLAGTAERFAELHDQGVKQRATQERNKLRAEMDTELADAASQAWGTDESLFRKDGSVNTDRCDAIVAKYRERNQSVSPGDFLLDRNGAQHWHDQELEHEDIGLRVMKFASRQSLENVRTAFEDNYENAVLRQDWDGAARLVDDVCGGLLTSTQAENRKLKLQQMRLREVARATRASEPVTVNVGGSEYTGLSAALAMEAARNGEMAESAPAADAAGEAGEAGAAPVFDAAPAAKRMPENEFGEVTDGLTFNNRVVSFEREGGGTDVRCDVTAPECVQRVAAHGNAHGGVDADQARMMVARITLDAVADNPMATGSQLMAMFDDAGIYEAMGAGDADVGKERCRAIVDEMVARGRGDTDKLATGAIKPMISAHLASREFAESREWGRVKAADPRRKKDGDGWEAWDKSDLGETERKRWFALYEVYGKYRKEFKPDAEGELDKDEFEENAQAFHKWYMDEKYGELKRADEAAAEDWYMMRMATDLREKVYADADKGAKYTGYSHDVQVAREVLRTLPPQNLGADELVAASVQAQKQDALRSAAFRKAAAADYEKLRGLKRSKAANSEAAARKREREQKAEERKAEKAARDAEKQAEKIAARKLFVARSAPREAAWKWDGKNAPDGALPGCKIPEAEYKRLVEELGYDGSQQVYVQVNGARIQVVGVSKSGKVELNAPAAAKVQKKPNSKKGERWKTGGSLGYSYYFKSTEAK